jgi:hypothetical protein
MTRMGVVLLLLLLAGVAVYVWHRQTGALDGVVEQVRGRLRPARPLPRRVLPRRLLRLAAQTVTVGVSGTVLVPTRIEISVHPGDLESFEDALDWLSRDIADALRERAVENGWMVPSGPEVVIIPDEERPLRSPRARGRLGALSADDISTLKHKGPLVVKPDVPPTAAAPPTVAPMAAGNDDETRVEPAVRAPVAADPPAAAPSPAPAAAGKVEAGDSDGAAPHRPHTPPTGYMAPVTAAAAAASAAAAAADESQQRERAVFLQLVAANGGDDVSAVVLASGRPVVLGRSREADIQVKDRKASGRHCAFALDADDGTLHVEDLQSTNGTYVGGKRVEVVQLKPGDTLGVGTSTWRVELDELSL